MFGIGKLKKEVAHFREYMATVEQRLLESLLSKLESRWKEKVEARLNPLLSQLETSPEAREAFLLNTVSSELQARIKHTVASADQMAAQIRSWYEEINTRVQAPERHRVSLGTVHKAEHNGLLWVDPGDSYTGYVSVYVGYHSLQYVPYMKIYGNFTPAHPCAMLIRRGESYMLKLGEGTEGYDPTKKNLDGIFMPFL